MSHIQQQFLPVSRTIKLVLLVIILFMLPIAIPTQAQAEPTTYTGADVLVIIDQSGSMGGYAACLNRAVAHNDPENIRFEAGQFVADWLATFAYYATNETPMRVGALYFGNHQQGTGLSSATLLQMNWTSIGAKGRSLGEFNAQNADLKALLSSDVFGDRDLCNTNFRAAFDEAQLMFDDLPVLEEDERHIRAIVILTDGYPCAPERLDWITNNCGNPDDERKHLQDIYTLAQTAFPFPDYQIHVVALDNGATPFWPRNEASWQQIVDANGGIAVAVDSPGEIPLKMLDILKAITKDLGGNLIELDAPMGENRVALFEVPPFLNYMRINVFRTDEKNTDNITVTDSQNNILEAGVAEGKKVGVVISSPDSFLRTWIITGSSEAVILPGLWQVAAPDIAPENVEVKIQQAFVNSNLEALKNTAIYEWSSVQINPSLTLGTLDTSIGFVPTRPEYVDKGYTLDIHTDIQMIGGTSIRLPLTQVGDTYETTFTPMISGEYAIGLCGLAKQNGVAVKAPNGTEGISCDDDPTTFTPLNTTIEPLTITVLPTQKEVRLDERFSSTSTWFANVPGKVYLDITDEAGNRIPNIDGTGLIARGILTNSATGLDETPFAMSYQPDPTARETFVGEFTVPTEGQYTLRVEVLSSDEQIIFSRSGWPLTITPVKELELHVIQPAAADQSIRSFDSNISIPVLSQNPLNIVVSVVDSQTKEPVEISNYLTPDTAITSPINGYLGTNNNTSITLNSADGIRFVHSEDYGVGNYAFTFDVQGAVDTTRCGCAFKSPDARRAVVQINRIIPQELWLLGGGALVLLVLLAFIGYALYLISRPDENPILGDLVFYKEDHDQVNEPFPIRTVALTPYRKSRIVLRGANNPFPKSLGIKSLEVTNNNVPEWPKQGRININYEVKGVRYTIFVDLSVSNMEHPNSWTILSGTEHDSVVYRVTIQNVEGAENIQSSENYEDDYIYRSSTT